MTKKEQVVYEELGYEYSWIQITERTGVSHFIGLGLTTVPNAKLQLPPSM